MTYAKADKSLPYPALPLKRAGRDPASSDGIPAMAHGECHRQNRQNHLKLSWKSTGYEGSYPHKPRKQAPPSAMQILAGGKNFFYLYSLRFAYIYLYSLVLARLIPLRFLGVLKEPKWLFLEVVLPRFASWRLGVKFHSFVTALTQRRKGARDAKKNRLNLYSLRSLVAMA